MALVWPALRLHVVRESCEGGSCVASLTLHEAQAHLIGRLQMYLSLRTLQ